MTAAQTARFEQGKGLYGTSCANCHQPGGTGQEGVAPPLIDSEWVLDSEQRLVRIVLQGIRGGIHVKGQYYDLEMPSLAIFDDEQVASILTYIRREWDHPANPVEPSTVGKIRKEIANKEQAWTEAELLKVP